MQPSGVDKLKPRLTPSRGYKWHDLQLVNKIASTTATHIRNRQRTTIKYCKVNKHAASANTTPCTHPNMEMRRRGETIDLYQLPY